MTAAPFCLPRTLARDPATALARVAESRCDVRLVGGGFAGLRAARH
jgi:NADPH-dependent 2,4-dienoyl-CoA reductase/sulfur reductase-like enzyme